MENHLQAPDQRRKTSVFHFSPGLPLREIKKPEQASRCRNNPHRHGNEWGKLSFFREMNMLIRRLSESLTRDDTCVLPENPGKLSGINREE